MYTGNQTYNTSQNEQKVFGGEDKRGGSESLEDGKYGRRRDW